MAKTREHAHAEATRRKHIAHTRIGCTETSYLIQTAFFQSPGPWRATTLSEFLGIPRSTIIRRLIRSADRGLVVQSDDGWVATDLGHQIATMMVTETLAIMMGSLEDFTETLLDLLKQADALPNSEALPKVFGFSPMNFIHLPSITDT